MTGELWTATRIAEEFDLAGPSSARTWLYRAKKSGRPIPVAEVAVGRGRHTYLYDSELVLAARANQPGKAWRKRLQEEDHPCFGETIQ